MFNLYLLHVEIWKGHVYWLSTRQDLKPVTVGSLKHKTLSNLGVFDVVLDKINVTSCLKIEIIS